jgi:hypothetical protein
MWDDRLSPGSKRFLAWLGITTGAGIALFSPIAAIDAKNSSDWITAASLLFFGLWGAICSVAELRRIPK